MRKLIKRMALILPAVFLVLSSFSIALAAPGNGVCQGEGEHQQINAKRFSFKGVVTGVSSDAKTMTLCGVPVDVSDAKVKGNIQAAKDSGSPVTAVGRVAGTSFRAQEVRVHGEEESAGASEVAEDSKDKDSGKAKGLGKGNDKDNDQPDNKGHGKAAKADAQTDVSQDESKNFTKKLAQFISLLQTLLASMKT